MSDDKWRDDSGTDHPQTIDGEPLEQTRSGKLLKEQRGGAPGADADDEAGDGPAADASSSGE